MLLVAKTAIPVRRFQHLVSFNIKVIIIDEISISTDLPRDPSLDIVESESFHQPFSWVTQQTFPLRIKIYQ